MLAQIMLPVDHQPFRQLGSHDQRNDNLPYVHIPLTKDALQVTSILVYLIFLVILHPMLIHKYYTSMFSMRWNNPLHASYHLIIYKRATYQSYQITVHHVQPFPLPLQHGRVSTLLLSLKSTHRLIILFFLETSSHDLLLLMFYRFLPFALIAKQSPYESADLLLYPRQPPFLVDL